MEQTLSPKALAMAQAPTGDRYVAGINWGKDPPPAQHIEKLTPKDAQTLRCSGRLERLSSAGGDGARATLTNPVRGSEEPRLLLTGTPRALEAMKNAAVSMLGYDGDSKIIGIHPYDTARLRKPTRGTVKDMEWMSGCRIVVEDQRKLKLDDPILSRRQHSVQLMGSPESRERATQLLTPRLALTTLESNDMDMGGAIISGFNVLSMGDNLVASNEAARVRRRDFAGAPTSASPSVAQGGSDCVGSRKKVIKPLSSCVVAGNGTLLPYMQGAFVCLGIRAVNPVHRHVVGTKTSLPVGGTRIGFTVKPPVLPLPETLLSKPLHSWVLGRGFVRGPGGKTRRLEAANVDDFREGEELGILVTRNDGNVALFRRLSRMDEWTCFAYWAAGISRPMECHVLLELGGAIQEVEYLLGRSPPAEVNRVLDEPSPEPRLWPAVVR